MGVLGEKAMEELLKEKIFGEYSVVSKDFKFGRNLKMGNFNNNIPSNDCSISQNNIIPYGTSTRR